MTSIEHKGKILKWSIQICSGKKPSDQLWTPASSLFGSMTSRPAPEPELTENSRTDLLVIAAGFTGLWTALLAKEENPSRDIVILEAGQVSMSATGRKAGFMDASITHGFYNGHSR